MSAAPVRPLNPAADTPSPERDALDRILRSDALNRAPNLVLLLRYVCEMQLAGRTDAIKEYNIAIEALGRSSDFDQKKDSIVRVEAHRLRKRLAEYYAGSGATDPVQIVLPSGSYVPVFQHKNGQPPMVEEPSLTPEARVEPSATSARPARDGRWLIVAVALGLVASLVLGIWQWEIGGQSSTSTQPVIPPVVPVPPIPGAAVRIAAGSVRDGFADGTGGMWQRDRFFSGGDVVTATPRSIRRTLEDSLYLARREGDFEYRIPVAAGSYEVRLHFAETVFGEDNVAGGGESSRVFQVQVNEGAVWTADVIAEADGANTAHIRVYRNIQPAPDGAIHVAFRPARKEAAFVNGIEVLPAPGGKSLPVRMLARATSLVLPSGEEFVGDQYSLGGTTVQRHEAVEGTEPSALYQAERFGHFSYAIPVASDTRYALTLRFAETWFGEGRPGGGGVGSRVFDVYCNGKTLLKNFDVLSEAGGPLRQLKKVFRNLEPNAQGKLVLQFVPIRNYAMVNSIEVLDEAR